MPTKAKTAAAAKAKAEIIKSPVFLVFGADDFLVQAKTKQVVDSVVDKNAGDFGLEVIEGRVDNSAQAVAALRRVDEALNTLSFFGGGKTVWLKNATFLGTSRTAETKDVLEQLESLAAILKRGLPKGFSFVVSATEMDKRRSFFKTLEKIGEVIALGGGSEWGKVDTEELEGFARSQLKAHGKQIQEEALQFLLELTGGNFRALSSELEKISTYAGDRPEITLKDVAAVGSASRELVVWELGDAIAERNLQKALKSLEQLLFQGENAIGMLFALVTKMRSLLLVRELIDRKLLQPSSDFGRFKSSVQRAAEQAADELPADRRFNPLLQHPYALFKTAQQAQRFTCEELRRALELLLDANKRLVSSSLDSNIVLEQTLIAIIQRKG